MATTPASRSVWVAVGAVVALFLLWTLRDVVVLLSFAVVLAYVLDPIVTAIERIRFPRGFYLPRAAAAAALMLAIVLGGAWLIVWGAPRLANEFADFIRGIPANAERLLLEVQIYATQQGMGSYVDPAIQSLRAGLATWLQNLGVTLLGRIGGVISTFGRVFGLLVIPLLTYYLLAEREDVKKSVLDFVPEEAHGRFHQVLEAVDRALKSYVRGQTVVSLIMGVAVGSALALLGFPLVLLLGVVVGLAEVLPYIGFAIAATAIALTGYGIDPLHAILGVGAYAVINTVIGFLVTPRVMGRHLKLHPFVITVSVLAGAELLGPPGALLALPTAAVLQSLATEFAPRGGKGRAK